MSLRNLPIGMYGAVMGLAGLGLTARAKEMALLGERIPADKALTMGLINDVFAPARLLPEVLERAARIAGKSGTAVSLTKRIMNRSFESSMEAILDDELAMQSFLFSTADSQAGVRRFLGKRGRKD